MIFNIRYFEDVTFLLPWFDDTFLDTFNLYVGF